MEIIKGFLLVLIAFGLLGLLVFFVHNFFLAKKEKSVEDLRVEKEKIKELTEFIKMQKEVLEKPVEVKKNIKIEAINGMQEPLQKLIDALDKGNYKTGGYISRGELVMKNPKMSSVISETMDSDDYLRKKTLKDEVKRKALASERMNLQAMAVDQEDLDFIADLFGDD